MTAMTTAMTAVVPLPAPGRVALRPAPRREPPFDDEAGAAARTAAGRYDQQLPLRRRGRRPQLEVVTDPLLADPERWSRSLLIAVGEIAAGRRPLQQLGAMFAMPIAAALSQDFERCAARGRRHWTSRATVRTVRVGRTADHVAEVCATLHLGGRIRAAALRLEARDGRWRCTHLQLG